LGINMALGNSPNFKVLGIATTFLASVIAWVFFRATSTEGAFEMIIAMFSFSTLNSDVSTFTNLEIYLILIAAFVAFFIPNTKEISESISQVFEASWASLFGRVFVGGLTGSAAAIAFIASQSTAQSPFLYFNF